MVWRGIERATGFAVLAAAGSVSIVNRFRAASSGATTATSPARHHRFQQRRGRPPGRVHGQHDSDSLTPAEGNALNTLLDVAAKRRPQPEAPLVPAARKQAPHTRSTSWVRGTVDGSGGAVAHRKRTRTFSATRGAPSPRTTGLRPAQSAPLSWLRSSAIFLSESPRERSGSRYLHSSGTRSPKRLQRHERASCDAIHETRCVGSCGVDPLSKRSASSPGRTISPR